MAVTTEMVGPHGIDHDDYHIWFFAGPGQVMGVLQYGPTHDYNDYDHFQ